MENRISAVLKDKVNRFSSDSDSIVVVDWKDITNEGIKVHDSLPIINPQTNKEVKGAVIRNGSRLKIQIDAFGESALNYTRKHRAKQCECVLYPCGADREEWLLFIETKYANTIFAATNPKNKYPETAIEQIKQTVDFFRTKGFIGIDKVVNAIISFPNLAEQFEGFILDMETVMDMRRDNKIIIRATNYARVINDKEIELISG